MLSVQDFAGVSWVTNVAAFQKYTSLAIKCLEHSEVMNNILLLIIFHSLHLFISPSLAFVFFYSLANRVAP